MDKFNLRYLAEIEKEKVKFGRAIGLPLGFTLRRNRSLTL